MIKLLLIFSLYPEQILKPSEKKAKTPLLNNNRPVTPPRGGGNPGLKDALLKDGKKPM